jgi:hypothetical protein
MIHHEGTKVEGKELSIPFVSSCLRGEILVPYGFAGAVTSGASTVASFDSGS